MKTPTPPCSAPSALSARLAPGLVIGSSLLFSCAGPTTPLGAVWALTPEQAHLAYWKNKIEGTGGPVIHFTPSRQVLHGPSRMRIVIEDDLPELSDYELSIRYNGLDVSRSFLMHAKISTDPVHKRLIIDNPVIRLSALEEHQIEVSYRSPSGLTAYARYDSPRCEMFSPSPVMNVADFSPSASLMTLIERISQEEGVNPAFATGLVAQESGFNPHAVSWAKAVGLTQVTPIAEQQILESNPDWPSYPEFNDRPVPVMKALILSGKVNSKNEWRLHREYSLKGGIEYTIWLARIWSTPENLSRIRAFPGDIETVRTRLILASYHSGYARVLSAVASRGADWLQAPELSEAKKYVNHIMSYCSYFSEAPATYENAS